jgi:hypothetical protein
MFPYPTPEQVFDDLGDKVVAIFSRAAQLTAQDLQLYRETHPNWVADASERGLANWIHDRLWAHSAQLLDGLPEITIVDQEPLREIYIGLRYRLRVKRHHEDGRVSLYPTQGALDFLEQQLPLTGLEEVRLIVGYDWYSEERRMGPAVLSLRDGNEKLLWKEQLPDPGISGVQPMTSQPKPGPTLPSIETGYDAQRDTGVGSE